jgi:hypothetical protein
MAFAAAAVVVASIGCGPVAVAPSPTVSPSSAAGPTPTPTTAPSSTPSPTVASTPSPNLLDTSTWTTYASDRYGFSIGHPADWGVDRSDHVWTLAGDTPTFESSATENFNSPDGHVRTSAWSVAVKPGTSADAWLQAYCPKNTEPCSGIQARAVAVSVDGHAGLLVPFTEDVYAFILVNDRMYVVAIWRSDSDPSVSIYGGSTRLLEAYVSTMHLLAGGPAPSATPRPS